MRDLSSILLYGGAMAVAILLVIIFSDNLAYKLSIAPILIFLVGLIIHDIVKSKE